MLTEFSHHTRTTALSALNPQQPFDILIIGGGITGAGAARDAALRGYKVALIDKKDFASGTSSKSTKLVHGGLRYLEHFEFGLVFEALQERRVLLNNAPHLVRPQPLLFPIYKDSDNGFLKLSAGMWLYDILALFRNVSPHRMLLGRTMRKENPGIRTDSLTGAARFYDAQTHDARLTLANAQQAHENGATLFTYTALAGFLRNASGKVIGATVQDELDGKEYEIHAKLIVNCTGPWTDKVIQMADPTIKPRLAPSKGVHIIVPQERLTLKDGFMVAAPQDARPVFIIPWREETIIGTTDTFYDGSLDEVGVTEDDVTYLLAVANHAFPNAHLTTDDVQSSWAGLRPLIKDPGASNVGSTSREHDIWEAPHGLLNIAGGKLTTYRIMAQQVIDTAAEKLKARHGVPAKPATDTRTLPLPGAEGALPTRNPTSAIADDVWAHLVQYYGIYAVRLAERVAKEPTLGNRIIETLPYIWAELPHAIELEQCLTADDFLARRTWLIYEAPHRGAEVLDEVVSRMADLLGWDEARQELERGRYTHELGLLAGQ